VDGTPTAGGLPLVVGSSSRRSDSCFTEAEKRRVRPDPCGGDSDDVPFSGQFTDWIEDLAGQSITGGCSVSPPLYCPLNSVLRQQMAAFLVKTFGLALY
jgi:hypothetical protein